MNRVLTSNINPEIYLIYQPNESIIAQIDTKYYFITLHKILPVYITNFKNESYLKGEHTYQSQQTIGVFVDVPSLNISSLFVEQSPNQNLCKDILARIIQYCIANYNEQTITTLKQYAEYYTVNVPFVPKHS